jgi:hypothetical protein
MKLGMLAVLCLAPVLAQEPMTQKLGELPGISQPHSLHIVGGNLVFLDGFTVHVYSLDPLQPKYAFGGEGAGPDRFKYWPRLVLQGDTIIGLDYLKTSWFSLEGDLLRTLPYTDFADFAPNMEMSLTPAGEHFIRVTADHDSARRFVQLLDRDLRLIDTLYQGLYDWRGAFPAFRVDVDSDAEHIVVSDSEKGFFISVFDTNGTLLRTIDKSNAMKPVPFTDVDRSAYLESVRLYEDPQIYQMISQRAHFKAYFPLINHVQIDNGKLYVTTERKRGEKHEIMVLDLEGRTLKTLFVSLKSKNPSRRILRFDPYVVHRDRLYEMVRNETTGTYELFVTDLK